MKDEGHSGSLAGMRFLHRYYCVGTVYIFEFWTASEVRALWQSTDQNSRPRHVARCSWNRNIYSGNDDT